MIEQGGFQPEPKSILEPDRQPLRPPAVIASSARRALLAAAAALVLAAVAYVAAISYPNDSPPGPSDVEARIASVFSVPAATADNRVIGDYLVERFYALDVETGEHYVADLLKGRITGIEASRREDGAEVTTLLLDLRNLQRDRVLYAAFVDEVARPQGEDLGDYLGLRTFTGTNDAFAINYDGRIPLKREPFRGPNGDDAYQFMLSQNLTAVTAAPRLVGVKGYNYLLSTTDKFTYFRSQFGVRAFLLSELIVVDATARPQKDAFFRLLQQFPAAR